MSVTQTLQTQTQTALYEDVAQEYICPLLSAGQGMARFCVGEKCMWWTKSFEVGDGCAIWALAELMTTIARWGPGWSEKEYRQYIKDMAVNAAE